MNTRYLESGGGAPRDFENCKNPCLMDRPEDTEVLDTVAIPSLHIFTALTFCVVKGIHHDMGQEFLDKVFAEMDGVHQEKMPLTPFWMMSI